MKRLTIFLIAMLVAMIVGCSNSSGDTNPVENITTTASGDVITDMKADVTGPGVRFDGAVTNISDLNDLVEMAWGDGAFGLHRGTESIKAVLEAYLGISGDEIRIFQKEGMNLAAICEHFGFDPENLVDTFTASYIPFLEEGVANGVIPYSDVGIWEEQIRTQFSNRVYWDGQ